MLWPNFRQETGHNTSRHEPVQDAELFDLVGLAHFFRRNTLFISVVVSIFLVLGVAYVSLAPLRYTARTTFLLDVKKPRAVQDQAAIPANIAELGYIESQVIVLQSALITERVVKQYDLKDDPEFNGRRSLHALLARMCPPRLGLCPRAPAMDEESLLRAALDHMRHVLSVQRLGSSQVIEIAFTSRDPETAASIANAVLTSYMEVQTDTANRMTKDAIEWLEQRIEELRRQSIEADRRLQDFKNGNGGVTDPTRRAFIFRDLQSTAESQQALYQGFLSRYAQTAQQLSFPLSDIRVLTPARPPTTRAGPSSPVIVSLAAVLGMILGVMLAAVRERLGQRLRTPGQFERCLGLSCLATLPLLPARNIARSKPKDANACSVARECASGPETSHLREVLKNPDSALSAAIGFLLARLETRLAETGSAVIGIMGIVDTDDQAVVSGNLAMLGAALDRRVLLIDGNVRVGSLTRFLAPNAEHGGIDVAQAHGSIEWSLLRDTQTGLSFLPCISPSVSDKTLILYRPDWISYAVAQAREAFSIIIVDLPGCIVSGEAHRAIAAVDELLIVVDASKHTSEQMFEAARALHAFQERAFGFVVKNMGRR